MNRLPVYALSDWGTSRFRLWLVDNDGNVLGETRSDDGMDAARQKGFARVLEAALDTLQAPADLPVMICGMAGARQGWQDAGYVATPADVYAITGGARRITDIARDVRILPGLSRTEGTPNVMRGEETQLLGAILEQQMRDGLIILPGTHSKWVWLVNGRVERFDTWLTGELYALLSRYSILRYSLGDAAESVDENHPAFSDAVMQMLSGQPLTGQLFSVRGAMLLKNSGPDESAARLSGLLIGAEIAGASAISGDTPVTLVASGAMGRLYSKALALAGLSCIQIDADRAVRQGLFLASQLTWCGK
ncbi:2-dehydro-3-deoxygalactonokinase [Entomohabitans teleogrylli]|uniref:2-dehydro-3-deoxygalactonokinase n=1 Tax=Entomohabitans teleogrylli TaxID=1384589 RepID=UPI00073DAB33|nr:2-dehydro-3-deoxygalactonokinase [Entomohabitans teleogrylli]